MTQELLKWGTTKKKKMQRTNMKSPGSNINKVDKSSNSPHSPLTVIHSLPAIDFRRILIYISANRDLEGKEQ